MERVDAGPANGDGGGRVRRVFRLLGTPENPRWPLRAIPRELVESVRDNVTIDSTVRENVRAHLRVLVKRILRKHGYPPDKQEKATQTVLQQAELLCADWAT
jgi:Type I restriction enzyme HindI endonuclease subunit-like, C-terminal